MVHAESWFYRGMEAKGRDMILLSQSKRRDLEEKSVSLLNDYVVISYLA